MKSILDSIVTRFSAKRLRIPVNFPDERLKWTPDDTDSLKAFLQTNSGKKLMCQLRVVVMESAFSASATTPEVDGYRLAALHIYNEIESLSETEQEAGLLTPYEYEDENKENP
jgi:hypothetical protein